MIGIYKITNPKGKIYIGQSINIESRFKHYQRIDCIKQPKIYRSLLKYGINNHIFEVIEECDEKQLNEREIYWGEYYNVLGKNGLVLRLGESKGKRSEITKRKIGINNKNKGVKSVLQYDLEGNFIKEWTSAKEASRQLNIKNTDISSCCKNGRNRTAGNFIWKFKSNNTSIVQLRKHKNSKEVCQYDLEGNFIKIWPNFITAGKELNLHPTGISQCCLGKIKKFKNYIWAFR